MISLSLKSLLLITSAGSEYIFLRLKVIFFFCDQSTTAHLFNRQHLYLLHLFPLALTAWSTALRQGFISSFNDGDDLLLKFGSFATFS